MGFLKTKEHQRLTNTCQTGPNQFTYCSNFNIVRKYSIQSTGEWAGCSHFSLSTKSSKVFKLCNYCLLSKPCFSTSNLGCLQCAPDHSAGLKDDQMSHELTDMLEVKKSLQDAFHPLFSIIWFWWSGKCLIVSEKGDQLWNQSNSSPSGGDGCANVFNWKCQIFFWYRSCLDADEENKLLGRWSDRPSVGGERKKKKKVFCAKMSLKHFWHISFSSGVSSHFHMSFNLCTFTKDMWSRYVNHVVLLGHNKSF